MNECGHERELRKGITIGKLTRLEVAFFQYVTVIAPELKRGPVLKH